MTVSPTPQESGHADGDLAECTPEKDVWKDPRILEAIALFEAGRYAEAQSRAVEAVTVSTRPPSLREDSPGAGGGGGGGRPQRSPPRLSAGRPDAVVYDGWQADSWRVALDDLATAHEDVGDPEHAEALYLRMLAWREGADQVRQGSYAVAEQLFKRSPEYRTVEDATWFLQALRPDDGHTVGEVVGLLALGEEVAAKAAVALWTLALRPKQRPKISECGGLELVTKAMANHGENAELQAAGCGALRLLCAGHRLAHRNRQLLIGRLGGPEALAAALRFHPHDPEVQREACGAFRAIANRYPAGARRILDNGGVALCLTALTECPDDEAVGEAACRALEALHCASEAGPRAGDAAAEDVKAVIEARLRAEREGALRFVEQRLIKGLERASVGRRGQPPPSPVPLTALLQAASILVQDDSVRHRALGLVEPVATCMQAFPGHKRLQIAACGVLFPLTVGHLAKEEAANRIASSGALGLVCQAMRDLECAADLQRLAVGVLMHVTKNNNEHKTLGVKAGGIAATISAMRRFPKDALVQERGIGALTNLCDTVGRSSNCARLGGVECVIAALRRHESAGHVAEMGCLILCMLCDDERLKQHVLAAGALPIAKALSRSGPNEAQRWARELLQELSPDGFAELARGPVA